MVTGQWWHVFNPSTREVEAGGSLSLKVEGRIKGMKKGMEEERKEGSQRSV